MAVNLIYKVKIDTKDAVGGIKKIDETYVDTLDTLEKLEIAQQNLNEEIKKVSIGSDEYKQLSSQLRQVNTELKNSDLAMEALDNEQLGTSIKSVAGGLTDIAGGLALIGVSGEGMEKVAETFAQVEGLSKVVGGAFDIWNDGLKLVKQAQNAAAASSAALTAAQVTQGVATKGAAVQQGILNAVMNANPVLLLVTGIGLLVGAFALFSSSMSEANDEQAISNKLQADYRNELAETSKSYADERAELAKNLAIAKDETQSKKNRENAIKNINAISPEYLGNITLETINTKDAMKAIDNYILSLDKKAKAQALNNMLTKEYEKLLELQASSGAELVGFWDTAGNSIKAQFEELGKGNFGSLFATDQETLMNATERNIKRGKVLKDQEVKGQQQKIDKLLELIKTETKNGEIENDLSDDAVNNINKVNTALDAAKQKRIDNSNELLKELNKLRDQEELDLAKTEDDKTKILLDREKKRLQAIYHGSKKTEEDKANLNAALLELDEKYSRDKQDKIDKANADAAEQARKNAIDLKNAELDELQKGYDEVEKLRRKDETELQASKRNEENAVREKYFRLIELAKKNGEDEKVFVDAQEQELNDIKKKYDKEELDNEKETAEKRIAIYKESSQILVDLYTDIGLAFDAIASGGLSEINNAFKSLSETVNLFTEDTLLKLQEGFDGLTDEEKIQAIADTVMAITSVTTEAINAMNQSRFDKEQQMREDSYAAEKELLDNQLAERALTQEEYDVKMKNLEDAKKRSEEAAKQKAFKQQKRLALLTAIMNTAGSVVAALTIPPPAGPVLAGVNAGLGAAQIAIISKQEYRAARGGIVPGVGSPQFDSVPALLAPGETVINSRSSSMFPNLLSEINQIGGGVELSPSGAIGIGGGSDTETVFRQNNVVEALVSSDKITKRQSDVDRARRNSRFE